MSRAQRARPSPPRADQAPPTAQIVNGAPRATRPNARTSSIGPAWRDLLGPLLDGREVSLLLNIQRREELSDLIEQNRLLALPTDEGEFLYPEFQFTSEGALDPTTSRVIAVLAPVVATPYTIAAWLRTPKDDLHGESPARWIKLGQDPEQVVAAAEHTAAHLAQ